MAVALSILGGLCELGGLVTVVSEIVSDRARASRLLSEPRVHHRPERRYPSRVPSAPLLNVSSLGRQPGQTDRELHNGLVTLANTLVEVKKQTDRERDDLEEKALSEIDKGYDELRDGLRDVLQGAITTRMVGVGVLALGIVLSATGSVLSNVG